MHNTQKNKTTKKTPPPLVYFQLIWKPLYKVELGNFVSIWCRDVLYYLDWTSHVSEIDALDDDDKLLLLHDRSTPSSYCDDVYRLMRLGDNRRIILTSGGGYLLVEPPEHSK